MDNYLVRLSLFRFLLFRGYLNTTGHCIKDNFGLPRRPYSQKVPGQGSADALPGNKTKLPGRVRPNRWKRPPPTDCLKVCPDALSTPGLVLNNLTTALVSAVLVSARSEVSADSQVRARVSPPDVSD